MIIDKIDITNIENIKNLRKHIQDIYKTTEEEAGAITTEYIQYTAYFQTTFLSLLDNILKTNLNTHLKNTLVLTYIHYCVIALTKSKVFKDDKEVEQVITNYIKEGIKNASTHT